MLKYLILCDCNCNKNYIEYLIIVPRGGSSMNYTDGTAVVRETRDKVIFWGIDGVLTPFRLCNHIETGYGHTKMAIDYEVNEYHIYLHRTPIERMRKVMETCDSQKNIVISKCEWKQESLDKEEWVRTEFPLVTDFILPVIDNPSEVSSFRYTKLIKEYCSKNNIDLKDVVYVDALITQLRAVESAHITSIHVSSFIDFM